LKSSAIILLSVTGPVAVVALLLMLVGVRISPIEPVAAIGIGMISGYLGILPLARSGRRDPSSVIQMALVGTVLHLLTQIVLGTALYATHLVDMHGNFVYWLLGEYWLSLIALIWQLKRMIASAIPEAKYPEAKVHN
jgi:hypothetical protein